MSTTEDKFFFRRQEIVLPDGESVAIDSFELFEKADYLAHQYGLGSHKTFTEFVNMVNNEDPFIINGLIYAASKRIRIENGEKVEEVYKDEEEEIIYTKSSKDSTIKSTKKPNTGKDEKSVLFEFLMNFGASDEELAEAKRKLDSGEIEIPEDDFSWITRETLMSPDFDLQGTLKKMRDYQNKSVNIKVSLDKMMAKAARKKNG